MRWKIKKVRRRLGSEVEIREMMWRVDQGHCKLDFRASSVPRVEKGPCKLDFKDLSVPKGTL